MSSQPTGASTSAGAPSLDAARLEIARWRLGDVGLKPLVRQLTAAVANALDLARVGVWLLVDEGRRLAIFHLHDRGANGAFQGVLLEVASFPSYFRALATRAALVAPDAMRDPRLSELRGPYLAALGIGSLMDAPILRNGELAGVVCHEHVGPPRAFSQQEIDFVMSVADQLSLRLAEAALSDVEDELAGLRGLRRELRESSGVGRLAAGLGHDLNNLLTVIAGNAELVEMVGGDLVTLDRARAIRRAIERGRVLAQELVDLGRRRPSAPRVVPIADHLARFAAELEHELWKDPGARRELAIDCRGLGAALIDPRELDRIVLGLVMHARARTEASGIVRLEVLDHTVADGPRSGQWVVIAVGDDGPIPAARETLFEPFSGAVRAGSGMGMALVKDIVTRVGGFIEVRADAAGRATIRAHLPRVA